MIKKLSIISLFVLGMILLPHFSFADTISTDAPTYSPPALVFVTCTGACGFDLFNGAGAQLWQGDGYAQNTSLDLYTLSGGLFTSSTPDTYYLLWPHTLACTGLSWAACQSANPSSPQTSFSITSPPTPTATTSPIMDIAPTASDSLLVFNEIVAIPTFILQNYETPLVGMGIIIVLFFAIIGILKLFDLL